MSETKAIQLQPLSDAFLLDPVQEIRKGINNKKLELFGLRENYRLASQDAIGLSPLEVRELQQAIKSCDAQLSQAFECEGLLNRCYPATFQLR